MPRCGWMRAHGRPSPAYSSAMASPTPGACARGCDVCGTRHSKSSRLTSVLRRASPSTSGIFGPAERSRLKPLLRRAVFGSGRCASFGGMRIAELRMTFLGCGAGIWHSPRAGLPSGIWNSHSLIRHSTSLIPNCPSGIPRSDSLIPASHCGISFLGSVGQNFIKWVCHGGGHRGTAKRSRLKPLLRKARKASGVESHATRATEGISPSLMPRSVCLLAGR